MCIRDRLQLPRTMRRAAFHISSPMSRAFLLLQDVLRGLCVDIVIPLPEATADHFFERGIAFQELFYFVHRDFCSSLDREPVDPRTYGGESYRLESALDGEAQAVPAAVRKKLVLTPLPTVPDRADSVDDMPCRQVIAEGYLCPAGLTASERPCLLQELRARRPVYSSVHASSTEQALVPVSYTH